MDLPHGTNIDMIRLYVLYHLTNETIIKGNICSVFDLLYKEYNKGFYIVSLSNKNIKGSAAEIIIHRLLSEKILCNTRILVY